MVKVKICGITNLDDAQIAQEAGADFLGFVFADSPRKIEVENAKDIISQLSDEVKIVALFVNETRERIFQVIDEIPRIDYLQFHGDELPEYCRDFHRRRMIKALRIKDETSLKVIPRYGMVDYILLDSFKDGQYGGTGTSFDWELAKKAKQYDVPIFLSGGLTPGNVAEAVRKVNPFCVDVSSGVEESAGKKSMDLVHKFVAMAKKD